MVLVESFEVYSQPWRPCAFISGHAQHSNDDGMRLITSVSGYNKCWMRARSRPLFDNIAFVTTQFPTACEDPGGRVFLQIAERDGVG